jgi:hypothetical protein
MHDSYLRIRQGCYSQEGDIVVLCAYLGQLARLRDALANEVAVVIDDRDQEQLDQHEDDKESNPDSPPVVERVKVTRKVHSQPGILRFRSRCSPGTLHSRFVFVPLTITKGRRPG